MKIRFGHFIMFLLACWNLMGSDQYTYFQIKEAEGVILAWKPWTHTWVAVRSGDRLPDYSLVQVGLNSSITFIMDAGNSILGVQADVTEVTINVPMVLRMERGIPRKVKLDEYFIATLPEVTKAEGADSVPLYHSFMETWQRFSANVLPQAVSKMFLKEAQEEKQDAVVAVKAKKIRLYNPSRDSIYVTEKFPYAFRVSWKKEAEGNLEYGIRLWRDDEERPEPLGFTQQDYYSVKIHREGNYLVQITTKDGRWQSEPRSFNVVLPMSGRGKPPSPTAVIKPLPLELPPRGFVFITGTFPVSISFVWGKPNSATGKQIYEFVLYNSQQKPLYRKKTGDLSLTLKLNEQGAFKWALTAYPDIMEEPDVSQVIYSEVRGFELQKYQRSDSDKEGLRYLEKLISTKASRVVFLDEGF